MAGADYNLSLNLIATDSASGIIRNFIGGIGGALSGLSNAFGNIAFGLRNMETAGTVGTDAIKAGMVGVGNAMWSVAGAATLVGGAVAVGIGVASVKAAGAFQTAMLSNVAHAGLAKDQIDKVSQAVLKMSTDVGRSPTELADALYPILSAFSGITNQSAKSALALDTLKLSFEAVAGTTVDGTKVATAAVGTFNALGLATDNAATNSARMSNLMDIMDKTVQDGNMQWGAYQMVISKLATSIQGTGIKFTEASAALAVLTNSGMTARQSQTYLANMFTTMAIKTDAMAKHAKALGISWNASAYAGMSLAQKMAYINQVTDGNKQKILALLGNNATALRSFNALSTGLKAYGSNLSDLNHAQGALKSSFDTASQGFDFQMSRIKAAGQALLITIGTQLLPILTKLASQVVPIITKFTEWISKSGAVKTAATGLSNAITGLIGGISAVVTFFQQNQVALSALQAILIVVGAFILGSMVVAFYAWAVAAWGVAAGMLAITIAGAPVWLIILAVIVVITVIILVIKNWGAISKWLSEVWKATTTAIGGFFSALGTKVHQALDGIGQKFSQLGSKAQDTKNTVGKHFSDMGTNVHNTATQLGMNVINAFRWMYDHNYYFHAMVDEVVLLAHQLQKWLEDTWNTIKAKVTAAWELISATILGVWQSISDKAKSVWTTVTTTIQNAVNTVKGWLQSAWNTITNWLAAQWNKYAPMVQRAWQAVSSVISGAWSTYISGPLTSLINQFMAPVNNLAPTMLQSGKNIIQSFINGITSMIGAAGQAAQGVAANVASFLSFHSPAKEGPGKDADTWAPNLMKMYASGITGGKPGIRTAATDIMATLGAQLGNTLLIGLNTVAPQLQSSALRSAMSVAGPIKGSSDGAMPSHIFDFVGSNYAGYNAGLVTTAKREEATDDREQRHAAMLQRRAEAATDRTQRHAATLQRREAAIATHIAKLENHYHVVVNHTGKGRWTRADAAELAKLISEQTRLQGQNPQTASGRRY